MRAAVVDGVGRRRQDASMLIRVLERHAPSRLILPTAAVAVAVIFGLEFLVGFALGVALFELGSWLDHV